MTTEIISVGPDTSARALAVLRSERGIRVPVVNAYNRVIGSVSEGCLPHRVETRTGLPPEQRTERRRSWWLDPMPPLVLWGRRSSQGTGKDVLAVCRLPDRFRSCHRFAARPWALRF